MITGRTVLIKNAIKTDAPNWTGENKTGDYSTPVEVSSVLIAPNNSSNVVNAIEDGKRFVANAYFPKTYTQSLADSLLSLDDGATWLHITGNPQGFTHDCPTKWNRVVSLWQEI